MRMDGRATCYRCGGTAHDYVRDDGKCEMVVQCCYCMAFTKVFGTPPERRSSGPSGKYVLKYGRYAGSTIEDVANTGERGIEYLRMLASDTPKLRSMITEYLDSRSTVSVTAATESHHPEPHRSPSRTEANIPGSP